MSTGGFPLQMAAIGAMFDRVTLVVTESIAQTGGLPLPAGAEVVGLREPRGADKVRKLSVITQLGYYLREISLHVRHADVVHVPVPGDVSFLGLALALAHRKRLIARYGSSWAVTSQTTHMQRVTRACMRAFAGGRNVMIATGVGTLPPAPGMRWLYATSLTQSELAATRPTFDRGLSDPPRLVYLGRLSLEKGVSYLLRALAHLRKTGFQPLPVLSILGDGPERRTLEAATRDLGLTDLVRFAGHLDRVQLNEQLKSVDLCVQPSLTESLCKAWLDALAHGLPLVLSNVGAAASVVGLAGERGWLFPAGDDVALADLLRRVLTTDENWPALRRRCRAFVEGRTLEAWAREIGEMCATQWGGVLAHGKLRP
jgi:glycosyltransferase involved in cell wall biosynthesis